MLFEELPATPMHINIFDIHNTMDLDLETLKLSNEEFLNLVENEDAELLAFYYLGLRNWRFDVQDINCVAMWDDIIEFIDSDLSYAAAYETVIFGDEDVADLTQRVIREIEAMIEYQIECIAELVEADTDDE